jgi:hypothetical protein
MSTETIHITDRPTTAATLITPETARRWLRYNINNRPVSRVTVERYKRDMLAGLWQFTSAGIAFDINGYLQDGQHRLIAISELPQGHAITMNVTRGLAPEAKFFIDQGRKRTPGSQLAMAGIKNYNATAAGARLLLVWQNGLLFRDTKQHSLITAPQIQAWVEEHLDLVEWANVANTKLIQNDAMPSVARAAFYSFAALNPEAARTFFYKLSDGDALNVGNPILTLRQRLENDRRRGQVKSSRDQLALIITAWNLWREGRTLKRFSNADWTAFNFPVPK